MVDNAPIGATAIILPVRATPLDNRDLDLVILGDKLVISLTHEHAVVNKDMFSSYNESLINNCLEEQQHVQQATADKIAERQSQPTFLSWTVKKLFILALSCRAYSARS
jgi:hypothetical protein